MWAYREAEIKHARLAMLAAAGWPISELFDRQIASALGLTSALDDGDRVPSPLNGGMLENVVPEFWGFCLGLCAAIDMYGVSKARAAGIDSDYIPGDLGFDPLNLYPSGNEGKQRMQLAEVKHGRVAMLAVTGFAAQEYISKIGVVDETPLSFTQFHRLQESLWQLSLLDIEPFSFVKLSSYLVGVQWKCSSWLSCEEYMMISHSFEVDNLTVGPTT